MQPKSYTIIVRNGKKHVLKEQHKDYDIAMARLEKIEEVYGDRFSVEFLSNY